jgi:uncharacterized membrane protein YcaP (DUF421 family)
MDFYQCFKPLYTATLLYLVKVALFYHEHSRLRILMASSVIMLIVLGESLFDKSSKNDAPVWLMAIPISIFIISQAALDVIKARY